MAISTTAVWEMRNGGDNTNGGFYRSDAGTTDYSQQDTAQLSLTDLASDGAGTGISSATGGFTAAMVGNGFRIESTGTFTAGWYEITAYTDTNNVTIDRSAGATKSGGAGKVGGAVALPTDALLETFSPGNTLWVEAGTYTFTGSVALSKSGAQNNHIRIIGYNTTRGDDPVGTDAPLFAFGAYSFTSGFYWDLHHLRATGTGTFLFKVYNGCIITDLDGETTSGASTSAPINMAGAALLLRCYSKSASGCGVYATAAYGVAQDCYFYDSARGGYTTQFAVTFNSCVADSCTTGFEVGNVCRVTNSTIYNATTGIKSGAANFGQYFFDNIFDTCTLGIEATGANYRLLSGNNFYNCTTRVSAAYLEEGYGFTTDDPAFTNAPGGDLSTGASMQRVHTFGGSPSTSTDRVGAVQSGNGGGGGLPSVFSHRPH